MKFLVDAHLPPGLCAALRQAGHGAIHTRDLPEQNATRDGAINEISIREHRVVISKDTDFYYSHLLQHRPWKLVLVRTGNLRANELKNLFAQHLQAIIEALQTHSLVELTRVAVRTMR